MNVKAEAYQEWSQAAVVDKLITNLADVVRFEASLDHGIVKDGLTSEDYHKFTGFGISGNTVGPWKRSSSSTSGSPSSRTSRVCAGAPSSRWSC